MRRRKQQGFTLIELMVVVVILGLLLAIVGPNIIRILTKSTRDAAKAQMAAIGKAIDLYHIEKRRLPEALAVLTEADAEGDALLPVIPRDPWDGEYDYRKLSKRHYEIHCAGPDGMPDSEDDLVHPIYLSDR